MLRLGLAAAAVVCLADPAAAVLIVTDLDPNQRIVADDPQVPGFASIVYPSSDLSGVEHLSHEVADGRSRASLAWVNSDEELSLAFDLARGGDSPAGASTAGLDGVLQFRVSSPVRYELSAELLVNDSGGGDTVWLDVTLFDITRGRYVLEQLFKGQKRSETTPNEHLVYGLAGGDTIDEEEGSLTGELLPLLPGNPYPDRRYELRYSAALWDDRDDPEDVGATATGSIVLRFTPVSPIPEPNVSAFKRDELVVDDGDGRVEPGETVEYTITVQNTGTADATGALLEDVLDPNVDLVVGSVVSSRGSVVSGNLAGDKDVKLELGAIPPGEGAEVTFRVILDEPFPEGVQRISNRGRVTGDNFPVTETDDPDTAVLNDDTWTLVANTPLDRCERDVEDLEDELRTCQNDLALALADSDDDGVIDLVDRCPGTSPGSETDDLGCSRKEFCAGVVENQGYPPALVCNASDWRNDEPLRAQDCRWFRGACLPREAWPGQRFQEGMKSFLEKRKPSFQGR